MAISLAFTVAGLMIAYLLFNVQHVEGKTLNAVLLENMTVTWGTWGHVFLLVTLVSEAMGSSSAANLPPFSPCLCSLPFKKSNIPINSQNNCGKKRIKTGVV